MKNKSSLARVIDKIWREPKGKISGKIRQICENMSHRQRLTVVTVMLSVFHPDGLLRVRSCLLQDRSQTCGIRA